VIWLFDRGGEKIAYEIERSIDQMRRLHEDGWKVG
jgi:hypothetical protein